MRYKARQIYTSIHHEGALYGLPMVFVELDGCNLNCNFCPIKPSKKLITPRDPKEIAEEVWGLAEKTMIRWVCITGGEPTTYELGHLVYSLRSKPLYVALETNGTRRLAADERFDFLIVSPKSLDNWVVQRGNELRVPVLQGSQSSEVAKMVRAGDFKHRYLQVIAGGEEYQKNIDRATVLAIELGVRVCGFPWYGFGVND